MRIANTLHLNTERGWRGGEAQTLALARGLAVRGHRSLVVGRPGSELVERAASSGLDTVSIPMRGEWDLRAARRLADLVRESAVGLLHYHTAHAVSLGTLATLFCGRRPAVASRRVSFSLRGGLLARLKYRYRVDRVIAVSEAIRRGLIAQGLPPERVVTVHSGIDPDRFACGDRARFRRALAAKSGSCPPEAFLVGTVGHLAAHKGLDFFLDAAALASRELPAARYLVVGRGENEERARRRVRRLGLADKVVFTGFLDDMPDVFAGLDLLVLASTSGEGSPAVLKEAMAAGTPVVATGLEGVEEIVEDGTSGLLTPPFNAPALARAMVILATDGALRSRFAAAARKKVGEFTIDRMIEKTEAVYRAIGAGL